MGIDHNDDLCLGMVLEEQENLVRGLGRSAQIGMGVVRVIASKNDIHPDQLVYS